MKLELFDYKQLNFVEFNTSGDNSNYAKCHPTSKFLHSQVFNLFAQCFEQSNSLYDYYGPTRYNARQFIRLKNELNRHYTMLKAVKSQDDFIELISNIFLGKDFIMALQKSDRTWDLNWEHYLTKLCRINEALQKLVDECIDQEKVLWVIGY